MDERGLIDLPLRVNGLEVKVLPVAPLAMAQNMEEVNAILQSRGACPADAAAGHGSRAEP
jgi:hypothetical protein